MAGLVGGTKVWSATVSDVESVDVTAIVGSILPPDSGGGSGSVTAASMVMQGTAFPNAKLTLLKDGAVYTTLVANNEGKFNLTVNGLAFGNYQFSLYAQDRNGLDSNPYTVNVLVSEVKAYVYSDIVLPPTIKASSLVIALGQSFTLSGYASPNSKVLIDVPGIKNIATGTSDATGFYSVSVTADVAGLYQIRAKAELNTVQSLYSKPVQVIFYKGDAEQPIPEPPSQLVSCVDYNNDRRVNLIDFSILLFWFQKDNPPSSIDCNGDQRIDIKDFSILMYFWTA